MKASKTLIYAREVNKQELCIPYLKPILYNLYGAKFPPASFEGGKISFEGQIRKI